MIENQTITGHIVILHDEFRVRDILRVSFESDGYMVNCVEDGAGLLRILRRDPVNLVVLGLELEREDSLEIARRIRKTRAVPVIMITSKGEALDRVVALDLGADDNIPKPFLVREMLAQIRSVVLPPGKIGNKQDLRVANYTFKKIQLDCQLRELTFPNGIKLRLTGSEFDLLVVFLENPKIVLTRDQITHLTKGSSRFGNDRLVDNQVGRLKRKIATVHGADKLFNIIRGVGYIFSEDDIVKSYDEDRIAANMR